MCLCKDMLSTRGATSHGGDGMMQGTYVVHPILSTQLHVPSTWGDPQPVSPHEARTSPHKAGNARYCVLPQWPQASTVYVGSVPQSTRPGRLSLVLSRGGHNGRNGFHIVPHMLHIVCGHTAHVWLWSEASLSFRVWAAC